MYAHNAHVIAVISAGRTDENSIINVPTRIKILPWTRGKIRRLGLPIIYGPVNSTVTSKL